MKSWTQTYLVDTGIGYGAAVSLVLGLVLQVIFHWPAMIVAGFFAGVFAKRHLHAFFAGAWGVFLAWFGLFMIQVEFSQAYVIGDFFASLIGIPGFGRFILQLSVLFGGFLGGTGALVGFSIMDLIHEFRSSLGKEENI